jgi:hypothetical protein
MNIAEIENYLGSKDNIRKAVYLQTGRTKTNIGRRYYSSNSTIYLSEAVVKHPAPRFLPRLISSKLIGVRFFSTSSRNSAGYHWV